MSDKKYKVSGNSDLNVWVDMFDDIFNKSRSIYYGVLSELVKNSAKKINLFLGSSINYDVIQYWDDENIPPDVEIFMNSWKNIYGHNYKRYNMETAKNFIEENFVSEFLEAFLKCYHPAMRSDFFRLCYLYINGGIYIDADELPIKDLPIFNLENNNVIMLHPFMTGWVDGLFQPIFFENFVENHKKFPKSEVYFNNAPIISSKRNNIILLSIMRAKNLILSGAAKKIGIHDSTGPSNLSSSVVMSFLKSGASGEQAHNVIGIDWNAYARTGSEEELSYKRDRRNWRNEDVTLPPEMPAI
ncbi:glycosyltransferase family 32 protein [Gluconacetobacter johannae]|uniref:Uncharacterized protein n=1 Tax=Gluconacetobacter johannae TaxID=112140 RepID=A0A7W4JA68_9PROT|nr:glycosyltransferase [Gluconacetobacter johannae]MBB2177535.1 hypothetical protein [Gluconacetobacter johannae]